MDTPVSISKQEAIDMFGGSVGALAAALGITRSAIYMWPDDAPIPELQAMRLRYELRPDAVPSSRFGTAKGIERDAGGSDR